MENFFVQRDLIESELLKLPVEKEVIGEITYYTIEDEVVAVSTTDCLVISVEIPGSSEIKMISFDDSRDAAHFNVNPYRVVVFPDKFKLKPVDIEMDEPNPEAKVFFPTVYIVGSFTWLEEPLFKGALFSNSLINVLVHDNVNAFEAVFKVGDDVRSGTEDFRGSFSDGKRFRPIGKFFPPNIINF